MGAAEARQFVKNIYRTFEDILLRIAPTENGVATSISQWENKSGPATIILPAKNVRPSLKQDIKLLDKADDNGKIIEQRRVT